MSLPPPDVVREGVAQRGWPGFGDVELAGDRLV